MGRIATIARRTFLIGSAALVGGAAFGYYYVNRDHDNPLDKLASDETAVFNPYVMINADGITVIAPRAEMGQGTQTTLAALVAEELDVKLDQINVIHGPAAYAYYNSAMLEEGGPFPSFEEGMAASIARSVAGTAGKFLGLQVTGGSSAMKDGFEKMRIAGAAAREAMVQAAAKELNVDAASLKTENGAVIAPDGKKIAYTALAQAASKIDVGKVALRDTSNWKVLGKPQERVDLPGKVTGAPMFGIDVDLPDMLYGTVKMSPRFWTKPTKADLAPAEAIPGVEKIIPLETQTGNGYGIIARDTWTAFKAAEAIEAEWEQPAYPVDSDATMSALEAAFTRDPANTLRDDGDATVAFADAPRDRLVEAEYRVPFLAHATMEPMNATARFKEGKLDIWCGNQAPTIVRTVCANAVGIEEENVEVHTTYLGGGFGRRGEVDFSLYASLIAKECEGRPVKVTWSREEDMTHDTYRPPAIGRLKARLDDAGMPVAIEAHAATASLIKNVMQRTFPSIAPSGPDVSMVDGLFNQPYTVENYRVSAHEAEEIKQPQGFWRAVGNTQNCFFHESFLDEIALAGKQDPIDMRIAMMKDHPVAAKVMEKLKDISDWDTELPAGTAKGVAFSLCFGSYVGQVVQISDDEGSIRIDKVWTVADVGTALDPRIIETQIESGAIFGLSGAMMQEITFDDGMVQEANFDTYDAMRMHQCPAFETAILENNDHLGGVGEIGTPAVVPALANAIARLTGERIRTLPLGKSVDFV